MKRILKYPLPLAGELRLELPTWSIVVDVNAQRNHPHIWIMVDDERTEKETRTFLTLMTGQPTDRTVLDILGSVMIDNGNFVVHVLEVQNDHS